MGTVHTSVAAVLRFIDAAAEKKVSAMGAGARIRIWVRQQNKVLWKDPGCAVILGQSGVSDMDIFIAGEIYCSTKLHVSRRAGGLPLMRYIWLQPSAGYPFSPDMTIIRGTCAKGVREHTLYAERIAVNTRYKLLETTAPGDKNIRLWGLDGIIEERTLAICENDERQYVTLLGPADDFECNYHIREGINGIFHREKASVHVAARIETDSHGNFIIAFRNRQNAVAKIRFWHGSKKEAELDIGESREYNINIGG